MYKEEIECFINKNRNRHLSNKVLHAHPSPACWSEDYNYDDVRNSLLANENVKSLVNMYVGIPYCLPTNPGHCGFCLFPTERYRGENEVRDYLSYVEKEAKFYKNLYSQSELHSLYIGGGTPNLLAVDDYYRLMGIITELFPSIEDDTEKTLEGIPQLFNENKIHAISDAGFNRVSMGVQQVNDRLIKYSGRKQTRKQVFDAIELFSKYNLAVNVDLIYAWPEQTIDDMLRDLKEITDAGVNHITHYELNIAGRSDFASKQKHLIPDVDQKIEMYLTSKQFLMEQGYVQRTAYDWEKTGDGGVTEKRLSEYQYENNLRDFPENDGKPQPGIMGGLGYAAINMRMLPNESSTKSISAMNHRNLGEYYKSILSNKLPVERAYMHNDEDVRLVWLYQSLQELKLDLRRYEDLFSRSFIMDYGNILQALVKEGWVTTDGDEIRLIGEGEFYTPLIQSLFGHERSRQVSSKQRKLQKAV